MMKPLSLLLLVVLLSIGCKREEPLSRVPEPKRFKVEVDRTDGVIANGVDPIALRVTLLNAAGKPIPGLRVQAFSFAEVGEQLPADVLSFPTFTDENGLATGTVVSTQAGPRWLLVVVDDVSNDPAAPALLSSQRLPVTFVAGPPTRLAFAVQPSRLVAGRPFSPTVQVHVQDAFGNTVPAAGDTIKLALSTPPAGATLDGEHTVTATRGEASFPSLRLTRAGTDYTLVASTERFPSVESARFSVQAAEPVRLVFSSPPTDVVAGEPFSPGLHVIHEDAFGNLAPSAFNRVTLWFAEPASGVSLIGDPGARVQNGAAFFSDLRVLQAGTGYVLRARNDPYAPALSPPFSVRPAAPSATRSTLVASMERLLGDGTFTTTLTLTVRDAHGNVIPGQQASMLADGEGHTFVPASAAGRTDARGRFSVTLASSVLGRKRVTATAGGMTVETVVSFARPCGAVVGLPSPPLVEVGGSGPLVVRDVDGDGRRDLLAADAQGATTVLRGLGDGTFSRPEPHSELGYLGGESLAMGDVDGDGDEDIVASSGDKLYVRRNAGGGSFSVSEQETGGAVKAVALGDLDADGRLDIAVSDYFGQKVRLLLNQGGGTFAPPVTLPVEAQPTALAIGDVQGDGLADLVVLLESAGLVSTFRGVGSGRLQPMSTFRSGLSTTALALGDLDGDGRPELALADMFDDRVRVLRNDGFGDFTSTQEYGGGHEPMGLVMADLTGDGRPELLVRYRNQTQVGVLRNVGDGTLLAPARYALGRMSNGMVSGDWNQDGHLDLVVVGSQGTSFLPGLGDGTFGPWTGDSSFPGSAAATGDFDGNGQLDVVVANGGVSTVRVLRYAGNGTFTAGAATAASMDAFSMHSLAVADFDGDGRLDAAVFHQSGNAVRVLRGRGDGTFFAPVSHVVGSAPTALTVVDGDGDGRPDLAVTAGHSVGLLRNRGDGTFAPVQSMNVGSLPYGVAAGDLDGDGRPELVTGNRWGKSVSVLRNLGGGTFAPAVSHGLGVSAGAVSVVDVNGDGLRDIVAEASGLRVLLNDGAGLFSSPVAYPTQELSGGQFLPGDWNRDGRVDFAFTPEHGDHILVMRNTCVR